VVEESVAFAAFAALVAFAAFAAFAAAAAANACCAAVVAESESVEASVDAVEESVDAVDAVLDGVPEVNVVEVSGLTVVVFRASIALVGFAVASLLTLFNEVLSAIKVSCALILSSIEVLGSSNLS